MLPMITKKMPNTGNRWSSSLSRAASGSIASGVRSLRMASEMTMMIPDIIRVRMIPGMMPATKRRPTEAPVMAP